MIDRAYQRERRHDEWDRNYDLGKGKKEEIIHHRDLSCLIVPPLTPFVFFFSRWLISYVSMSLDEHQKKILFVTFPFCFFSFFSVLLSVKKVKTHLKGLSSVGTSLRGVGRFMNGGVSSKKTGNSFDRANRDKNLAKKNGKSWISKAPSSTSSSGKRKRVEVSKGGKRWSGGGGGGGGRSGKKSRGSSGGRSGSSGGYSKLNMKQ